MYRDKLFREDSELRIEWKSPAEIVIHGSGTSNTFHRASNTK